jgi:TRAP-type C4-dicarboxylate transport system permease small subunit
MKHSKDLTDFASFCDGLSLAIARVSTWCAGALLVVNVMDMLFGVASRYLFQSSPVWTEELARYTLVWMVMMAANAALRYGEHMKIDMLLGFFPDAVNLVLKWIRRFVFVFITGFMTYWGVIYSFKIANFTTMGLGISKAIPMAAIPVGMGLLMIQYMLMQCVTETCEQGTSPPSKPEKP